MIWKYRLIATIALIAVCAHLNNGIFAQEKSCSYLSFSKNGKWGELDRNGKTVIQPIFESIIGFNGESALAKKNRLWGIIDKKGKWIVKPAYESVSDGFFDGFAYVVRDKKYYFIDRKGNSIGGSFDGAGDFNEGLGRIKLGDHWGVIDSAGGIVISAQYDDLLSFSIGIARAEKSGKVFYINTYGVKVLELPENMHSGHFSEGMMLFDYEGSEVYGYVDTKGKVVIEPRFSEAQDFEEGRARVYIDGKYGFIDKTGKVVVSPKYDDAEEFGEGLAVVRKGKTGSKYGFINKYGGEVLPFAYDDAAGFQCGVSYVEKDGKWGYIDKTGTFIFKPRKLD